MDQDKSTLVVLVPEPEQPLVADFRDQFDISAKAGLGAHVSMLLSFLAPDCVSGADLDVLEVLRAAHARFTLTYARAAISRAQATAVTP